MNITDQNQTRCPHIF